MDFFAADRTFSLRKPEIAAKLLLAAGRLAAKK
jgi:hypothetical protein